MGDCVWLCTYSLSYVHCLADWLPIGWIRSLGSDSVNKATSGKVGVTVCDCVHILAAWLPIGRVIWLRSDSVNRPFGSEVCVVMYTLFELWTLSGWVGANWAGQITTV